MGARPFQRPRDCTIPEVMRRVVAAFPEAPALVWPRRHVALAFAELDARSLEAARAFTAAGVRRGERARGWSRLDQADGEALGRGDGADSTVGQHDQQAPGETLRA